MKKRPGGKMAARPLHFIWICDTSGSMQGDKINSLNFAIRETLPEMRQVADENPHAQVLIRVIKFSHGAHWHVAEQTPLAHFSWHDLVADPLQSEAEADIVFLMDNSVSMNRRIEALKRDCVEFADRIIRQGAKVKMGLVGFSYGKRIVSVPVDYYEQQLTRYRIGLWPLNEPTKFKANIQSFIPRMFGGQGCYLANTNTIDIFPHVIDLFGNESSRQRALVIVSDGLGTRAGVDHIVQLLQAKSIKAHVLGVRSKNGEPSAHELLAKWTGGQFWELKYWERSDGFDRLLDQAADTIGKEMIKTMGDGAISKGTDMGHALDLVAQAMDETEMTARGLPPVLVLVSDGKPSDDFGAGLKALLNRKWGKKAVRVAIAIGKDADHEVLRHFSGDSETPVLKANNSDALLQYIRWASTAVLKSTSAPMSQGSISLIGSENELLPPVPQLKEEELEEVW